MRQVFYAMQFRGQAEPADSSGTVLKAKTRSESCTITSTADGEGITGRIAPAQGEPVTFESEVRFTGDTSFDETGTIRFGPSGAIRFSTIGDGHIDACADPALKHGCVRWRIDGGDGKFEGATGLITSNFLVSDTGGVTDNHFGVIFLR